MRAFHRVTYKYTRSVGRKRDASRYAHYQATHTTHTTVRCDGCGACRPSLRRSLNDFAESAVIVQKKLRNRCSTTELPSARDFLMSLDVLSLNVTGLGTAVALGGVADVS
jgi:hypothetical protein